MLMVMSGIRRHRVMVLFSILAFGTLALGSLFFRHARKRENSVQHDVLY